LAAEILQPAGALFLKDWIFWN